MLIIEVGPCTRTVSSCRSMHAHTKIIRLVRQSRDFKLNLISGRNTALNPNLKIDTALVIILLLINRQHVSYGVHLEVKREDYQSCIMLCCVRQLCTMIHTREQFLCTVKCEFALGLIFCVIVQPIVLHSVL